MSNLVSVPWQPGYKLTPDTLALLIAAGKKINTQLRVSDAWRSYAEQAYYYDRYINHGGNPASNPDTGQRNHMRGAAFDLVRTDATAQAACRVVGLIRDADEAWHWNNPNWARMPIIPTDTATAAAGSNAAPIVAPQTSKEFDVFTVFKTGTSDNLFMYDPSDGSARPVTGPEWTVITTAAPDTKIATVSQDVASSLVNGHLKPRFTS